MFKVVNEIAWPELEKQIRKVALLQPREGRLIYPYENAHINLEELAYAKIRPTSLYLLKSNLKLQQKLAEDLSRQGYDPLELKGMLTVQEKGKVPIGLIPPIVEETDEEGMYILDGMHRAYLGWSWGRETFWAVHIKGVRADCPVTALPNNWEDIKKYDTVPADPALKRRYRPNHLSLRRDFSPINGSKPRIG